MNSPRLTRRLKPEISAEDATPTGRLAEPPDHKGPTHQDLAPLNFENPLRRTIVVVGTDATGEASGT